MANKVVYDIGKIFTQQSMNTVKDKINTLGEGLIHIPDGIRDTFFRMRLVNQSGVSFTYLVDVIVTNDEISDTDNIVDTFKIKFLGKDYPVAETMLLV